MSNDTREDGELTALRDLLQEHDLLPDVPDALLADSDAEQLLSAILASPAGATSLAQPHLAPPHLAPVSGPPTRRRGDRRSERPARRRSLLSVAAAAVLVLALVGTQSTRPAPATAATLPSLQYTLAPTDDAAAPAGTDLPAASGTLLELAATARSATTPAQVGRVQHVVTQEWVAETTDAATDQSTAVYPTVTERWVSPDGSTQVSQRRAPAVTYDGSLDPGAKASAGGPESTDTFLPGHNDPAASRQLSRDPEVLTDQLLAASTAQCDLDGWAGYCLAEQVQEAFLWTVVPDDLAGAFWEALSEQPSVELLGTTTDRVGRTGTAVAVDVPVDGRPDGEEAKLVLVISPDDGQLLATEQLTLRSALLGVDEPTVTAFRAITSSGYTTSAGR